MASGVLLELDSSIQANQNSTGDDEEATSTYTVPAGKLAVASIIAHTEIYTDNNGSYNNNQTGFYEIAVLVNGKKISTTDIAYTKNPIAANSREYVEISFSGIVLAATNTLAVYQYVKATAAEDDYIVSELTGVIYGIEENV